MIDWALETAKLEGWPDENVHSEHFSVPTPGNPFVVKLATSGKEIHVGEHQSILEALEQAGVDAPYLCRGGACGQCITRITNTEGGAVHHNDHYLTDEEKKEGDRIATCVSRMDGGCLTLIFDPQSQLNGRSAFMNTFFKDETFRDDFTFANSPRQCGGFPSRSTKTATCMRSTSSRMYGGPKGSVYEFLIDVDEHYVSEMRDRALVLEADPLRCQSLPHMMLAQWDMLELLMTRWRAAIPSISR